MRLRRNVKLIIIAMFILIAMMPNWVHAEIAKKPKYLGISETNPFSEEKFGYGIGDPKFGGAKIWNIWEYTSETSTDPTDGDIYCVKAGVGFSDTRKRATYNVFFDMKKERDAIKAQNETLASIVDGTLSSGESKYNSLLALLDMLFLKDSTDLEKKAYLEKAGIREDEWDTILNREDIDAVQQAAIWYFTNYGEEDNKYDKTGNTSWLTYTTDGSIYDSLSGYNPTSVDPNSSYGFQRQRQAEVLYKYLIKTAKANSSKYESSNESTLGAPAKVNTDPKDLKYIAKDDKFIIGPINITETEGNAKPYTIDFNVKNGNEDYTDYEFLNSSQDPVEGVTVKDLVGKDFYISVPKDSITTITIDIKINFSNNTMVLWASTTNAKEQPVVIPGELPDSITWTGTVAPKEFDLALRKYITKVKGTAVAESRVPNIDESTLSSGTTATYKHKKDPVKVETDDVVTYELTIYNEGEKAGRATKIIDQLPEGLTFNKVVSGNFEKEEYDEVKHTLRLIRKSGNNTNLPAYTPGKLASEKIEIECIVEQESGANDIVLTNVAWISEEIEEGATKPITIERGQDRDSEPATTPAVDKGNMSDYTGNDNKEDLTDKDYYYKGQQDDDDFEKLILEKATGSYNLDVIKVDKETKAALAGAEFEVTINNGTPKKETVGADGKLSITGIEITDTKNPDVITIKETRAPDGYNKLIGTVKLSVTKKVDNGKYVVDTVTVTEGEIEGLEVTEDGETIKVTVPNEKQEGSYNLDVIKVDKETKTALSGAEFEVTVNNGTPKKETVGADGKLSITGIEITDLENPDTITIVETKAPAGYNKLIGTVKLSVTKKIENGKYVLDIATITEGSIEGLEVTKDGETIKVTVPNEKQEGNYNLDVIKIDKETKAGLSGAEFEITVNDGTPKKVTVGEDGKLSITGIEITDLDNPDTITIKETQAPEGYNKLIETVKLSVTKKEENGKYIVDTVTVIEGAIEGLEVIKDGETIKVTVPNEKREGSYNLDVIKLDKERKVTLVGAEFEVTVNNGTPKKEIVGTDGKLSITGIEITDLENPDIITIEETQAPEGYNKLIETVKLSVTKKEENGKYIVDTVTVIEGAIEGLEVIKDGETIKVTVPNEKQEGSYNLDVIKVDKETKVTLSGAEFKITLPDGTEKIQEVGEDGKLSITGIEITDIDNPDTIIIEETKAPEGYKKLIGIVKLEVKKELQDDKFVITEVTVKEGNSEGLKVELDKEIGKIKVTVPNEKIKDFDLALRKFIAAVSKDETIEKEDELRNSDGSYTREPVVDTSKLNTIDENGDVVTTAIYNHTKEPVLVQKGDFVVYNLRVYNEGEIDGYASEIKDHLPPYLEFVDNEFNKEYGWKVSEDGRTVTTRYLENELIKKAEQNEDGKYVLDYKEVPIMCKVKNNVETNEKITNIADITEDLDKDKKPVDDRDSEEKNVDLPKDEELPSYKDDETGEYIPGQEDDDDFEKIIVKEFDLALRKFITAVSKDEKIEEGEELKNQESYTREPVVDTTKLNTEDEEGKLITTAVYNHTKEPILVQKGDYVVYMLRVYNEGEIDGYASEIKDHLPPHLEFVDNEFNKQYGWEVSKDGRTVTTKYLEDELIKKAEKDKEGNIELDYKEVPIMCRVKDTAKTNENITNIADITEYQDDKKEPAKDRDSKENNVELPEDDKLPSYKDEEKAPYVPGQQDDDDFEKVIVKEFDLALRKWVTQAMVTENGKTTVTNTGHKPYDDPEQIVKVELNRKKLNQVVVKFKYSIRVVNEGDVAGYVKEITDYVPAGLKFVAEDNPGWKDEGNNVISTKLLENKLLQPGEYADVEVILTWINSENNMGVMVNTAEISEDDNEYDLPDRDSTPDNQKQGEDDIDDAPVMISIITGKVKTYFALSLTILITIAGGLTLIKKYVL